MSQDLFAMYAQKADNSGEGLYLPEPIPHETTYCDLKNGIFSPVSPMKNITTEEDLADALAELRQKTAPFLAELAPVAHFIKAPALRIVLHPASVLTIELILECHFLVNVTLHHFVSPLFTIIV